jgi:hypothetical protein
VSETSAYDTLHARSVAGARSPAEHLSGGAATLSGEPAGVA